MFHNTIDYILKIKQKIENVNETHLATQAVVEGETITAFDTQKIDSFLLSENKQKIICSFAQYCKKGNDFITMNVQNDLKKHIHL